MSFYYRSTEGNVFHKNLECHQCNGRTKKHRRCHNRTCQYLPYCHLHSKSVYGVKVAESKIPNAGRGLYAVRQLKRKKKIVPYEGEILNKREIDARYGPSDDDIAPYAWRKNNNYIIDSCCKRSLGAYSNAARNVKGHRPVVANAKFCGNTRKGFSLCATKNIHGSSANPEEIYTSYGRGYFARGGNTNRRNRNHHRVPFYETKKSKVYVPKKRRRHHQSTSASASASRSHRGK